MKLRSETLPVVRPLGGAEEVAALKEVIESGWWGKGPRVEEFEQRFADLVGSKYAIAVSSNSHGQDLVLKALGISGGDVINPAMSFMTSAIVPVWNQCSTNVVDVDRKSLNISVEDVRRHLTPETRAIIAVHFSGVLSDVAALREVFDGPIIEDCAHSCWTPGAGQQGDFGVWSFQATKTIASGDGGMITLDDERMYRKLKDMTWFGIPSTYSRLARKDKQGRQLYRWDYEVEQVGYKCYMTDIIAALCLVQLDKLHHNLAIRREVQRKYNESLHPLVERPVYSHTAQYYGARVPREHRNPLMTYLVDKKILTTIHYKPLHEFKVIRQHMTFPQRTFPVTDEEWHKILTLPCHAAMTPEDIDYVIYWVNAYFESAGA